MPHYNRYFSICFTNISHKFYTSEYTLAVSKHVCIFRHSCTCGAGLSSIANPALIHPGTPVGS